MLKKGAGLDLRGRTLETMVIIATTWLVVVSWGLVGAFFGGVSKCHGIFGQYKVSMGGHLLLNGLRSVLLKPAMKWFLMWDRLALNSGPWLRKALCMEQKTGCFEHLHKANADFFFEEQGGAKCASDMNTVAWLFISAGLVASGNHLWKRRERQRRAARRPMRGEPRPHQD